ncbi:hypothetical protein [Viridibacillus arvi]|uniref:hypothetical protein n=1 Tax=Viridibacillus arvi TaxID=263475 RepID=UPI0034CF732D
MNEKFTCIEGVCCAGKSSVIKTLESEGYEVVHETHNLIKLPPFPTNTEEARRNERILVDLEQKRSKLGLNAKTEKSFADRMLPSVIAVTIGMCKVHGFKSALPLFDDIISILEKNPNAFYCDAFVYFKTKLETIEKRNITRPIPLGEDWIGKDTLLPQFHFYDIFGEIVKSHNWIVLPTDEFDTKTLVATVKNIEPAQKRFFEKEQVVEEFKLLKSICQKEFNL